METKLEQIISLSHNPSAFGKPMKRKILQLGKRYYWKEVVDDNELIEWLKEYWSIPKEYNSCLINIYEKGESIGWHTDRTKGLVEGSKVYSCSYGEKGKKLGVMKFTDGTKYELKSKLKIDFDPFIHARLGIKHTASSNHQRFNFTFRQII